MVELRVWDLPLSEGTIEIPSPKGPAHGMRSSWPRPGLGSKNHHIGLTGADLRWILVRFNTRMVFDPQNHPNPTEPERRARSPGG